MAAYRDRTGELHDEEPADLPEPHDALCRGGWLPMTTDGRARPCLTCRPHLRGRAERLRSQLTGELP